MACVEFEAVEKVYPGGTRALHACSLAIADGELLVLGFQRRIVQGLTAGAVKG